jgi:hypothetical protein
MSPATHLFASWLVAAKTTNNLRDCRLVALSGILPDADGVGILVDFWKQIVTGNERFFFYQKYHHLLLHGWFGALVIAFLLTMFARQRLRVFALSIFLVHLHLLCDFVGSRGPSAEDIWPIFYLAPFSTDWMWTWKHQLALDAWPNRIFSVVLFGFCIHVGIKKGYSFIAVFNRRIDEIFVSILRKWKAKLRGNSYSIDSVTS